MHTVIHHILYLNLKSDYISAFSQDWRLQKRIYLKSAVTNWDAFPETTLITI